MKITIDISDNELRERITELIAANVAKQIMDGHNEPRYMFSQDIKKITKKVIEDNLDAITDRAVASAARSIEHRGVKKLMDKLHEEAME